MTWDLIEILIKMVPLDIEAILIFVFLYVATVGGVWGSGHLRAILRQTICPAEAQRECDRNHHTP